MMEEPRLLIYNSQTRRKEPFIPQKAGEVRLYVCGVTVYDECHIGHARSFIVFDAMVRYLKSRGFTVHYIRNFTDVDDKIIVRAKAEGISASDLAQRYIRSFHEDMAALSVERATHEPRATGYIPAIIHIIEALVRQGNAYEVQGNVYFAVEKFPGYGKLSGRNLEEMMAGARVEPEPGKNHPMDFALWKAGKPGEPQWESPWGPGRPGWHIECSAMSTELLGPTLDIHGGGKDLIFPHHENELAQTEAYTGKTFVRYWVHNGFVTLNREKMSKSLGNFLTIREMLSRYHPEVVRLFLLSSHYRSPLDYSEETIRRTEDGLTRLYSTLDQLSRQGANQGVEPKPEPGEGGKALRDPLNTFHQKFETAMSDDFNTARAIGYLFDLVKKINRVLMENPGLALSRDLRDRILQETGRVGEILGILKEPPAQFLDNLKRTRARAADLDEERIEALVAERNEARRMKDWARADAIRRELTDMKVTLLDSPEGTTWKFLS
jgi:cysteinyl-tRNA synthetase